MRANEGLGERKTMASRVPDTSWLAGISGWPPSPTPHPFGRRLDSPSASLAAAVWLKSYFHRTFTNAHIGLSSINSVSYFLPLASVRNALSTCPSPKGTSWVGQSVPELMEWYWMHSLDILPSGKSLSVRGPRYRCVWGSVVPQKRYNTSPAVNFSIIGCSWSVFHTRFRASGRR